MWRLITLVAFMAPMYSLARDLTWLPCPDKIIEFVPLSKRKVADVAFEFGANGDKVFNDVRGNVDTNAPAAQFGQVTVGKGKGALVYQVVSGKIVDCERTLKKIYKKYGPCIYTKKFAIVEQCDKARASYAAIAQIKKGTAKNSVEVVIEPGLSATTDKTVVKGRGNASVSKESKNSVKGKGGKRNSAKQNTDITVKGKGKTRINTSSTNIVTSGGSSLEGSGKFGGKSSKFFG